MPPVQASPATITLNPIADTYVESDTPNVNFGGNLSLHVRESSWLAEWSYSYLKFDLSTIPSSSQINSATLEVYASTAGSDTSQIGAYYCSDTSWSEVGITWNTAPSFSSTPTATTTVAFSGQWYSWDITSDVQNALSTRKSTVVLKVQAVQKGYFDSYFSSKDAYSNKPSLVISYTLPKASSSISCSTSSSSIVSGESITVSGSISPLHAGKTVTLTYERPDGSKREVSMESKTDGSFEDSFIPENTGLWKVTATWEGDDDHEGTTSTAVTFSVEEKPPIISLGLGVVVVIAAIGAVLFIKFNRSHALKKSISVQRG